MVKNLTKPDLVLANDGPEQQPDGVVPVHATRPGAAYNPVTGIFYTPRAGHAEISFYDMNGIRCARVSRDVMAGSSRLAIDRNALPKGMYLVRVMLDGKLVSATKTVR